VVLGTHEDGSTAAIKIIDRGPLSPDAQIQKEIKLARRLRHRNVVGYKQHFVTKNKVYLAMELASGGELYDQLEAAGRFDEDRARELFAQVLEGVAFCHSAGVCHRDLKLENVLVAADGDIKLTDFGFSKDMTHGSPKSCVGTALYVAPEIVLKEGSEYDGKKADVWSLGIILYLLTVGRFPFNRGHVGGVAPGMSYRSKEKFRNDNFRVPPHMSDQLTRLLRRILCADPARRADIAEIRAHPWFCCGSRPPVTPPGTPGPETAAVDEEEQPLEWDVLDASPPAPAVEETTAFEEGFDDDIDDDDTDDWDGEDTLTDFGSLAL